MKGLEGRCVCLLMQVHHPKVTGGGFLQIEGGCLFISARMSSQVRGVAGENIMYWSNYIIQSERGLEKGKGVFLY